MTHLLSRLLTFLIIPLTLGMSVFTILDLLGEYPIFRNTAPIARKQTPCIGTTNLTVRISRATLAWLIAVPVGSAEREVMQGLGTPYCLLPDADGLIQVAYPCEWDPSTWIVIVFQKQQYAGYQFSFDHSQL